MRIRAALAAVAAATLGTLLIASPAAAADPHYATGAWQLRDWAGTYPEITTTPSEQSEVTCSTAALVKPAGDVGTSYENTDLALAVETGDIIAVEYELSHADNALAGAVRMFAYDHADADTLNEVPTFGPAIADPADGTTGTLTIEFLANGTVGTFGLTYDASNATSGMVTFTNLRVFAIGEDPTPISLCAAPEPEPSASPTATATTATTTSSTSTTATLPVTGASIATAIGAGLALIVVGGVVLLVVRRRRGNEA